MITGFISLRLMGRGGCGMFCQEEGKFIKAKIIMERQEEAQSGRLECEMGSRCS